MTFHPPDWLRRLLMGASLGAFASAAMQVGMFVLGVMIARNLGPNGFGTWAVVYATLLSCVSFASIGIAVCVSRFSAQLRRDPGGIAHANLVVLRLLNSGLTIATSVVLFLLAGHIARGVLNLPEAANLLRIGCLFVFCAGLASFWTGAMIGYEAYGRLLRNNAFAAFLIIIGGAFCLGPFGLEAALSLIGVAMLILLMIHYRTARRLNKRLGRLRFRRNLPWAETLAVALPAGIAGLLTSAVVWLCQALLLRAGGAFEVAYFTAANGLRSLALLGLTFLTSAALVVASSTAHDPHGGSRLEDKLHLVVLACAVAGGLTLLIAGPPLLMLYGNEFAKAAPVVAIFAASIIFEAAGISFYNGLLMRGRLLQNFFVAVVPRELTRILLVLLLVDRGALGVGWSFLGAAVMFTTVTAVQYFGFARRRPEPSARGQDKIEAGEPVGISID